jgi:hypothetical protein
MKNIKVILEKRIIGEYYLLIAFSSVLYVNLKVYEMEAALCSYDFHFFNPP